MQHAPHAPAPSDAHAKLIDDLGGPKKVADAINARLGTNHTGQAVSNWKRRGIPYRYRGPLVVMAQENDVSAPPDFFGISSEK